MAFRVKGSLNANGGPVLRDAVIKNGLATTKMDAMTPDSSFDGVTVAAAGSLIFGHLQDHVTFDGVGVETSGVSGAESGSYLNTFTAAADNQTVAKISARCDISKATLYSAEIDATPGTTTGSDRLGYNMDLIDENTLDESTASTSSAQYNGWGVDPDDATRVIVNIYESSVFGV